LLALYFLRLKKLTSCVLKQENGQIDDDDIGRWLSAGSRWTRRFTTRVPDVTHELVEDVMSVPAQTGAEYNVYGINSLSGHLRLAFGSRTIGADYKHGQPAIGYQGTLKDLAAIVPTPGQTELETFFEPGAKLFTLGLVQGVLVADPNRFFSAAHRDSLVGWFPLNEHVDDNLPVVDHSSRASNLSTIGISATDRRWSDTLGWYLALPPSALLVGDKVRFDGNDFTVSGWLNGDDISGTGISTIFEYGPVSFRLNAATNELSAYVRDTDGNLVLVGRLVLSGWSFVTLRMSAAEAVMGLGSAGTPVVEVVTSGSFASFSDVSSLVLRGCGIASMGLHDLRLWSQKKTYDELDQIRDYQPTETQTGWQIGSFLTLNRRDRYGVKILSNGLGEPAVLPAWYRVPRLAWVTRYSSLGLYSGEDRFNEVGLGSGPQLPAQYKLGQQFYNLAAVGQTVVSTQDGIMPGLSALWLNTSTFRLTSCASSTPARTPSTPSSRPARPRPWPNPMEQTNPNREEIWVLGDNGYMYKDFPGEPGHRFCAACGGVHRARAHRRRAAPGRDGQLEHAPLFRAANWRAGDSVGQQQQDSRGPGRHGGGSRSLQRNGDHAACLPLPEQPRGRGRAQCVGYLDGAIYDNFGNEQVPPVPALDKNGPLEFDNSGTLVPGNYKLTVISGNIGKADQDFDGFAVEISVDATVIQRRLCEGLHGFNFQGTDTFRVPGGERRVRRVAAQL
jgi:hypothetical protein